MNLRVSGQCLYTILKRVERKRVLSVVEQSSR